MSDQNLTPQQHQVLALIATGSTLSAAAEAAGIHRNTISKWRRTQPAFKQEFHEAQSEQAMHWRDQMQSLGAIAVDALNSVLTDPQTSPATRLKAALAVLNNLMKPVPEPQSGKPQSAKPEPATPVRPGASESKRSEMPELLCEFDIHARKMERFNLLVEEAEILWKETADVAQACTIESQLIENKEPSDRPSEPESARMHNVAQSPGGPRPTEDLEDDIAA